VALRKPAVYSTGSKWSEGVGQRNCFFKRDAVLLGREEHGKMLRYEESKENVCKMKCNKIKI
jgi:hypothetical protein